MAKFFGRIGYAGDSVETTPGVWVDRIVEKHYQGDVIRNYVRMQSDDTIHADISSGNSISIVADEFAVSHISRIRYVVWAGALWTVTRVEVKSPRLILNLGGVYNGPTP